MGNAWRRGKMVKHPGIDARNFTRNIQAKYQPVMAEEADKALQRAAMRSGWSQ
jgi:hypothetical protein